MATIGHFEKLRALCGNTRLLITGGTRTGATSQVVIFDHVANKVRHTLDVPAHVLGLCLQGDHLLCAGADGILRIYETESGRELRAIHAHTGACAAVAAGGPDRIYTAGADGLVRRWDASGKGLGEWPVSAQALRTVAIDPTGEYVAAAGDDAVVHVITPANSAPPRDMPGHEGPVYALAFTPRDGRLVSGGDDGTLRIWYLVGAIESETRSADGQTAAVRALLFPPTPAAAESGSGDEPLDRVFAAGADGKVRVFRLEDRRKPRTLDCGSRPVFALGYLPPTSSAAKSSLGAVAIGGDSRTVHRCPLELDGTPGEKIITYEHGFDALHTAVGLAKPAREAAYKTLAALDEPEALQLLLRQLGAEKEPELRSLIAEQLGRHHRLPARAALRQALDDGHAAVRQAALQALRQLEGTTALSPLRAALRGRHPDVRQAALWALLELRESSPLVGGLITAALTDEDGAVRLVALDSVLGLFPGGTAEPLRLAFERGPSDIRSEVLVRAGFAGLLTAPELAPLVARALDDEDAEVRRIAFALAVLLHRPLAALLERRDEDFARTTREILRREALRRRSPTAGAADGKDAAKEPTDAELAAARTQLMAVLSHHHAPTAEPAELADKAAAAAARRAGLGEASGGAASALREQDLQPLLTAMSCRTPGTALRGARGLALLGDTRALGALLQLSRESEPALRREAAHALRALNDSRARKRLIWMLDDSDAGVRAAALDAYADLCGGQALQVAEAALQSCHEDIRVRGLNHLIQLGSAGQRTAQVETLLGHALEDEASKVRTEALRTLWSWHERDPQSGIAQVLERTLAARFPDLRLRAVEELLRLGKQDWAQSRLKTVVADRDAEVAQAAYDALIKLRGKEDSELHLLAAGSTHSAVREAGARGASSSAGDMSPVRAGLMKLLDDADAGVRAAALETLDRLLPKDSSPHYAALQGSHLDLRVRAAELLAIRHDERLIDPMRTLLQDKDLSHRYPPEQVKWLRLHAAMALASLGAPSTVRYFAIELIKDEHPEVREQAARGLATAARAGDEGYLLDLLGHGDIWVRSWGADGLARLGDSRALPVLTGTLRHDHLPIRFSAIVSFAALGPEGYGGMLQGLEDASSEVQEIVFAIILSRDLYAFRRGQPPELLASALSSQRAEVRFAAARALELRTDPETFLAHVIGVLLPPKPDKAQDMKDWPDEESRGRLMFGLAELLASDRPDQRYAAAQVLRLRRQPLVYFREARRLARPQSLGATVVPDTTPRAPEPAAAAPRKGWLRRLFHGDEARAEARSGARSAETPVERPAIAEAERAHLLRLSFGAYVGLLRQVTAGEDERVRRDAIDRIVELGLTETIGRGAALPAVVRALDDPHYLVRKAAFAGLKQLFPVDSTEPLQLAVRAAAADVAKAALAEFAARGASSITAIGAALSSPLPEVRRNAFELLERLSPAGSLEPLLLALQSEYADLRIGVIERLATQRDARVTAALQRAMLSDHDDLRLRAAELLAERKDDRAAEVLGLLLRAEDRAVSDRAQLALLRLGSERAVQVLAGRLERDESEAGAQLASRKRAAEALGQTGHAAAVEPLAACLEDESTELRDAAFTAALELAGRAAPASTDPWQIDLAAGPASTAGSSANDDDDEDYDEDDYDDDDEDDDEDVKPRKAAAKGAAPAATDAGDQPGPRRHEALLLRFLRAAVAAKEPTIRLRAAQELGRLGNPELAADLQAPGGEVDALLCSLFSDRDAATRKAAVAGYSRRVIHHGAALEPLLVVLRAGARDLLLPAAEGAAARGHVAALRPLLLLARAGEDDERARALLALGSLGDGRGLQELLTVAAGGTKEAPVEPPMRIAATEALGRIAGKLTDPELRQSVIEKVEEASASDGDVDRQRAAVRGLRFLGGERARSRLEGLLLDDSTNSQVQVEAAQQLGLLADPAAETALAKALDDWDDDVHRAARLALYRLFPGERTRVEFLAVDCRNDDLSEPAAAYLAQAGDPAQLVPRLATLRDEELRRKLRYGLLRREHLALAELVSLLQQPDPVAREAAAWLLGARAGQAGGGAGGLDAAALAALTTAERSAGTRWAASHGEARQAEQSAWVRLLWAACNAALAGGDAAARQALAKRVRELVQVGESGAPTAVREQAVRALARVGAESDVERLAGLLVDADNGLRTAAAAAMGVLAPTRAFAQALATRPFDAVAFAGAAQQPKVAELSTADGRRLGLPQLIATRAAGPLLEVLSGSAAGPGPRPDTAARIDAAAALGRVGGAAALAALRATAFDKKGADEALRKAAYRAYKRAQRHADRQKKYEAQP